MAIRVGLNAALGVDVTGGSTYVDLGCILDMSGPDASRSDINVSCLSDLNDVFRPGPGDGGTFSFNLSYDPSASTNRILADLYAQRAPLASWQLTFPVIASTTETRPVETWTGYVNNLGREISRDSLISQSVSVKVSGDPGYTVST